MESIRIDLHRGEHAVYVARDSEGVVLYVGESYVVLHRLGTHASKAKWFSKAASIEIEWHPDRASAHARESELIDRYQPEFNVRGRNADSLYLQRMVGRLKCSHCPLPATHIHCNTAICENCREVYGLWNSMSIEKALKDRQLDHAAWPI